jgi:acyl-CoA reductase-like NAD-dependent aldehyde dehydrogenase
VWQNTYNHFDPTAAFGGYKESGFGREGRDGRAAAVHLRVGVVSERLPVRKTYKLFIGGSFVRSESGGDTTDRGRSRRRLQHPARLPQGRPRCRGAPRSQGAARAGSGRTAYNRGQILYRFAEALESRAADIGARAADVEASIDVLVHYAGWTDKLQPVLGGDQPGRRAVPVVLAARADRRGRDRRARRAAAARPRRRAGAGARRGNTVVAVLSDERPLPAWTSAR